MFLKGLNNRKGFLNKMVSGGLAHQKRTFTGRSLQAYIDADKKSADKETREIYEQNETPKYQTLVDYSHDQMKKQEEVNAAEAEWWNKLRNPEQKKGIFANISQINNDDHHHLKYIKNKISKLVRQELDYLQFQEKLKSEDVERMTSQVYNEVKTKSNFYFSVDENKKSKNLKIFNTKAPGNAHRHASVILPHENVHIQRWFNTKDLTEDKLFEIYGYYSHLIDLHISQVRPQNANELSYIPKQFNQLEVTRNLTNKFLDNMYFEYYHRWREPTRTWFSKTQELDHQETLKNRPTTHHYDHDKGSEHDVEWTEDQKFPHVADRLGYPHLREEPIEKILGFERAPAHPGYQFQPFVQTPSMDPDPTLNFEQGEVIYENKRVLEWVRFWKTLTAATLCTWPAFLTFELYAGDGAPSLSWMSENWSWWQIPQQFQDGDGWGLEGYRYCDDHNYMNIQYSGKRTIARPAHTFYMVSVFAFMQQLDSDYVTKMVYNKDKDLVFVYRPTGFWNEHEYVYEMHHLEQMVPAPVTAYKDLTINRDDGILTVYDMSQREFLKFYNENKYWNVEQKEDFLSQTQSMWRNKTDKYDGQIFNIAHRANEEVTLTQLKVDREMQEAIKKHGTVSIPKSYEDEFHDRIKEKAKQIASNSV